MQSPAFHPQYWVLVLSRSCLRKSIGKGVPYGIWIQMGSTQTYKLIFSVLCMVFANMSACHSIHMLKQVCIRLPLMLGWGLGRARAGLALGRAGLAQGNVQIEVQC